MKSRHVSQQFLKFRGSLLLAPANSAQCVHQRFISFCPFSLFENVFWIICDSESNENQSELCAGSSLNVKRQDKDTQLNVSFRLFIWPSFYTFLLPTMDWKKTTLPQFGVTSLFHFQWASSETFVFAPCLSPLLTNLLSKWINGASNGDEASHWICVNGQNKVGEYKRILLCP